MSGHLIGPNGEPVGRRSQTFQEWVGGENASKYATREQVVAFANLQLREQIVPLIANALRRYDAERRANRWDRRFLRWLARLRNPIGMTRAQARDILTDIERRRMAALDDVTRPRTPESDVPRGG